MVSSRKKIIKSLFAALFMFLSQSCVESNRMTSYIEVIESLRMSNKCLYMSNENIINLFSQDTVNNINYGLYKDFDKNIYIYLNSFRNDFIFKLENGQNKFFDVDTIKIFQIKNWNNEEFIFKYINLSIDSLRSKTTSLNKEIKSFSSSKFYFDENEIDKLVDKLKDKSNNAYDVLKIVEMIKSYYLIALNNLISSKIIGR